MKRLISIALALSLLGSSAAMAHGNNGRDYRGSYGSHSAPYRGDYGYRRDRSGETAAIIGMGVLALGLFATLSSQNSRDVYANTYVAPAPRYGYGYGYGSDSYGPNYAPGYDRGYDRGYARDYNSNYGRYAPYGR